MKQLSIKLVRSFYNPKSPLQVNAICTNCYGMCGFLNPQDIIIWWDNHTCPTVIPIENKPNLGNVDIDYMMGYLGIKPQSHK